MDLQPSVFTIGQLDLNNFQSMLVCHLPDTNPTPQVFTLAQQECLFVALDWGVFLSGCPQCLEPGVSLTRKSRGPGRWAGLEKG